MHMKGYKVDIEIFEGDGGKLVKDGDKVVYPPDFESSGVCAWMYRGDGQKSYRVGDRFSYPKDAGKLCPWLLGSMDSMIQALRAGGTLGWHYKGTPYEKVIDPDGVTTEYVRCVDPTKSGIVVKITRTAIPD
jgi:uncharacterized repeat protein (TIGR04076 family)